MGDYLRLQLEALRDSIKKHIRETEQEIQELTNQVQMTEVVLDFSRESLKELEAFLNDSE